VDGGKGAGFLALGGRGIPNVGGFFGQLSRVLGCHPGCRGWNLLRDWAKVPGLPVLAMRKDPNLDMWLHGVLLPPMGMKLFAIQTSLQR